VVTVKPRVSRARTETGDLTHGWVLARPAFGFGRSTTESYPTWRAAHQALDTSVGSAGPVLERQPAGYFARHGWWGQPRPKWIEA
jgi:hypothetical protein